jgi:hypothetical protein
MPFPATQKPWTLGLNRVQTLEYIIDVTDGLKDSNDYNVHLFTYISLRLTTETSGVDLELLLSTLSLSLLTSASLARVAFVNSFDRAGCRRRAKSGISISMIHFVGLEVCIRNTTVCSGS